MMMLVLGLALFWAAHGLKIHMPAKRAELVAKAGEMPVKGGVAVALLLSVWLMVKGYQSAEFVNLWYPPAWAVHLNNLLMLVAVAFFFAAPPKSWLADKVRHCQLAGVKTWAIAHLLVNGDLASVVLFGGMLAWAVVSLIAINKRDGKPPRAPVGTLQGTVIHAVITLVAFGAMAWVHNYAGVWPFGGGA